MISGTLVNTASSSAPAGSVRELILSYGLNRAIIIKEINIRMLQLFLR